MKERSGSKFAKNKRKCHEKEFRLKLLLREPGTRQQILRSRGVAQTVELGSILSWVIKGSRYRNRFTAFRLAKLNNPGNLLGLYTPD